MSTTLPELTAALGSRARAVEALHWVWKQPRLPEGLPASVPGVSHRAWRPFAAGAALTLPQVRARTRSSDGTLKYALDFGGAVVETVLIPAKARSTVCVSSQVGCTRRCAFCATARLGFTRQLTAAEMVAQFLVARLDAPKGAPARNVVFMGMGEPMDNLDQVLRAVQVLTQSPAPQLRAEAVTVSTSGVLPGMVRFLRESKASLALSLNATTDPVRERLMPQDRQWPLGALLDALRDEAARSPRRQHFVEYVLFEGLNDSDDDADRLVELLRGVPARVNLIPHNPFPQSPFRPTADARLLAFRDRVVAAGLRCLIRWPRGRDIAAACGQLALAEGGAGFGA